NHGKHVTGGSQDHYGSSYDQLHPISDYSNDDIENSRKTGILILISHEEIEVATD
ncbi:6590_t:CDS:2, partial [Gigaspora margarita]